MRTRPQPLGVGLALAVAALLTGCGGSDGAQPASDPAATAAYVAKVDPLCKAYAHDLQVSSKDFEATQHRAGAANQNQAAAERYRAVAADLERFVDRAEAIDPPPAALDSVDAWLSAERRQVEAKLALADELAKRQPDTAAIEDAQTRLAEDIDAGRTAIVGIGFRYCE